MKKPTMRNLLEAPGLAQRVETRSGAWEGCSFCDVLLGSKQSWCLLVLSMALGYLPVSLGAFGVFRPSGSAVLFFDTFSGLVGDDDDFALLSSWNLATGCRWLQGFFLRVLVMRLLTASG